MGVPLTTVTDYVGRAVLAGLCWPLPADLDDDGLEALLFPPVPPSREARPLPEWAKVHRELRRKSVTLQLLWLEYREQTPRRVRLQPVLQAVPGLVPARWTSSCARSTRPGEKLFVDFPGETIPI